MITKISKRKSAGEGMFRPLKKKRFSDQIADLIQKKILEDNLAVGTGLPSEIEMAQEFQVSRSVIREALRISKKDLPGEFLFPMAIMRPS
jgi:DNA-binding GntR family transcriptional regulator